MSLVRTALVNPPNVFGFGYAEEQAMPPLGLAYIAGVLRQDGYIADLFDLGGERPLVASHLAQAGFFDYDVYGFTAYTKSFSSSLEVLSLLRRHRPHAIVVFGGPHASPCAEALIAEYPDIDAVVCREGEYPMLQFVRHLQIGAPDIATI